MKKILFTAVSALALAAFADGVNSTEFGVLYVPSSAKKTIVAVPWLESGTGTSNVSISNLVLTAGLENGDKLTLYSDESQKYTASWNFNGTKWTKGDPGDDSLPRGKAIMLKRDNPGAGFYIMGKPSNTEGSVTLAKSSSGNPAYTLVAPPFVGDTDVNTLSWVNISGRYDALIIQLENGTSKTLSWNGTKWQTTSGSTAAADVSITAGHGAWFVSSDTKTSGNKTVSWK